MPTKIQCPECSGDTQNKKDCAYCTGKGYVEVLIHYSPFNDPLKFHQSIAGHKE